MSNPALNMAPNDDLLREEGPQESKQDLIIQNLPKYAQPEFEQLASLEVRQRLIDGYQSVQRWVNHDSKEIVNPEFQETDLDHILQIMNWARLMEIEYPKLWKEIFKNSQEQMVDFFIMMGIHDIHEIVLGDLCRVHSQHNEKSRKHRESLIGGLIIDKYLDVSQAERVKNLYRKFESKNCLHKSICLGHLLDKGQASQNVGKNIIPFTLPINDALAENTANRSLVSTLNYAKWLAIRLSDGARRELSDFVEKRIFSHFQSIENERISRLCQEIKNKFPLVLGNF